MWTQIGLLMHCENKGILQWNINGLEPKLSRLQNLLREIDLKIIALQEIKINENKSEKIKNYFRGYNVYKKCRQGPGGGVCLAIHSSIPSVEIPLNTNLEVIACTAYFKDIQLNICNVYFNEEANISYDELNHLLDSVPSPKLILGDMNAKHVSWGSINNDNRGQLICDIMMDHNLFNLNDGSPTYYRLSNNYYSHLDLTFISNLISHNFSWETYPDLLSSDHYPIIIRYQIEDIYTSKPATWIFSKADWNLYKMELTFTDEVECFFAAHNGNSLSPLELNKLIPKLRNTIERAHQQHAVDEVFYHQNTVGEPIAIHKLIKCMLNISSQINNENTLTESINKSILEACNESIPKTSTTLSSKYSCFWWNESCKEALSKAKKELRTLQRHHRPEKVGECRRLDALASRTLLEAKRSN